MGFPRSEYILQKDNSFFPEQIFRILLRVVGSLFYTFLFFSLFFFYASGLDQSVLRSAPRGRGLPPWETLKVLGSFLGIGEIMTGERHSEASRDFRYRVESSSAAHERMTEKRCIAPLIMPAESGFGRDRDQSRDRGAVEDSPVRLFSRIHRKWRSARKNLRQKSHYFPRSFARAAH